MRRAALNAAMVWLVLVQAAPAAAGPNDLVLSRLGTVDTDGPARVVTDNQAYRSVMSELGVVLAPRLLTPADTLGFGGFHFAADLAFSTISSRAGYWRVLESSPDPLGSGGAAHGDGVMTTVGLFVRKGMWLPAPSFELGAGVVQLTGSRILAAQGYAKLALHEGYHDLALPSLAVRAAVSRVMGSEQVDLTIASFDMTVSKAYGVAGSLRVEPYAGWNTLFVVPRSEVIDRTPHVAGDIPMLFAFHDQASIVRHRLVTGVKLQHHVFALILEADLALAGSSVDDVPGTTVSCADAGRMTALCDATDQANAQQTYSLSVALDF